MSVAAPRVIVVGSGFAGFFAARTLERALPPDAAELVLVNATDHLCYSPLLPEVAAGRLDPRRLAISLHGSLRRTRILQGLVDAVDFDARTVSVLCGLDAPVQLSWDRLVLTLGSATRTFSTPGVAEHALGLKTLVEATYIHDHVLRQLELADATDDRAERRARLTFLVVGAGYTGTVTAAQLQRMTLAQLARFPRLARDDVTWMLPGPLRAVLPELGRQLGRWALAVVRRRGMQVRLGATVKAIGPGRVTLSDDTELPCHTVLWNVGVTPPPLVGRLNLPVAHGRLVVDEHLKLREDVWAAGDSAAARNPFDRSGADYPPTAQHAQRQGVVIGHNVAASLGHGRPRRYRHRDLGLVADLGGTAAVARPLGIPVTGVLAKVVTKGYHLYALPATANRSRVGADWLVNLVSRPIASQLGLVRPDAAQLASAEHSGPSAGPPAHAVDHPAVAASEPLSRGSGARSTPSEQGGTVEHTFDGGDPSAGGTVAKTGRTAAELGRERGGPNRRVLCTGARAPGAGRARLALEQSRAILADARREAHPGDRYRLAHLAALRAAAALLSVHPDEAPSRRAPQSAWALIGRRVPRFADWAAYLGAGAATRAAAEAGIADAVSDGQAAELLDAVELFTFLVAAEVQDQRPGPAPVVPQAVGGGG